MNVCLLMMGGSGVRFGSERPKQFIEISGKPVFSYILAGLNSSCKIDHIIIVSHADWIDYVKKWSKKIGANKLYGIIPGGDTRSESVKKGLIKAREIMSDDDIIMIHDATHPYVDHKGLEKLIDAVNEVGAATMVQRQADTCYGIDDNDMLTGVIPRQYVVSGASPEAFHFMDIYRIYMASSNEELLTMTSAGAIALANGVRMKVVSLNTINLKITYPEDMEMLKQNPEYFFK